MSDINFTGTTIELTAELINENDPNLGWQLVTVDPGSSEKVDVSAATVLVDAQGDTGLPTQERKVKVTVSGAIDQFDRLSVNNQGGGLEWDEMKVGDNYTCSYTLKLKPGIQDLEMKFTVVVEAASGLSVTSPFAPLDPYVKIQRTGYSLGASRSS